MQIVLIDPVMIAHFVATIFEHFLHALASKLMCGGDVIEVFVGGVTIWVIVYGPCPFSDSFTLYILPMVFFYIYFRPRFGLVN